MKSPRVVSLEFNELCPTLIDRFISEGKLPNFQRLRSESHVYITEADEQKFPYLEPWIQWVTIHSGMPYKEHGVFHLGEGPGLKAKCVWDVLSSGNFKVAICGSMNPRYDTPVNGYVLPDPWTVGAEPYPGDLLPYAKFVQTNVQEHSNDRVPLSKSDYVAFLRFMLGHGLSLSTITAIVRQLLSERGGRNRWMRAFILDRLQFDVFRSMYKRTPPDFSTFFLNSTAHMQHAYWRNMQPELFQVKPTDQEQAEFSSAVLAGYKVMDELVGEVLDLVDDRTYIFFSTALSQQPCLIYEESGGKVLFRPKDFEKFLAFAGVQARHQVAPVMAEQFYIYFETDRDTEAGQKVLGALRVEDEPALLLSREGLSLFGGCCLFRSLPKDAKLKNAAGQAVPFFELFYEIEGMKSGMHHPDGMLWIRTPEKKHRVHPEKVELMSIAPTMLGLFGVPPPVHMKGQVLGDIVGAGQPVAIPVNQ
jgi:hypothetical protein